MPTGLSLIFFILVNKKNKYRKVVELPSIFAHITRSEFKTRSRFFLHFENCRCLDRVLNSVPASCHYITHPVHFLFIFLQLTISSKSSLLLLQELPTENLFFDISRTDPYSPLSSHQRCKFVFLFGLLFFAVKLKYPNSRVSMRQFDHQIPLLFIL
jgi:hypothetical protein